ncbi:MAG: hypothetical protein EZS28_022378 [Streblomastix strix]|uniref:Uncharacterized protein n=1 Tax=Streblomastix strix TaxID=222440 RepID=A0A5J4VHQ9_9EUKA|nr:MAG: hypothetical protein EZS28_022378 [Streblomastix strix]
MADADPPALNIQPENNLRAEQPPAALQTPQMKQDAVLPFMKSLLNQTAHTPEEEHQIQQINSAKLLIEQYYNEKVADMDPTGRHATKYELEALDDRIQSTLGLEVNKKGAIERAGDADLESEAEICKLAVDGQRAAATAITSMATGDFESATQWMLTSHHYDRITASKAQLRRVQALVPDIFKGLLGPNVRVTEVLCQKSKEKLKEQAKTAKLIEQPKEPQPITPKSIQLPQNSIQQAPTTPQAQQYQQPIIQILPLLQLFSYQSSRLPSHQQPYNNNSNNFRQWSRGRGGPFKRDRQGIISPYLNYYNSHLQQPSSFPNQQQNQFQSQFSSLLPNQPASTNVTAAPQANHE